MTELEIENMNIFDEDCLSKINDTIRKNINLFDEVTVYNFNVRFSIETGYLEILKQFNITKSSSEDEKKLVGEKISDMLSEQLDKIVNILDKFKIQHFMSRITGTRLEKNTVLLQFELVDPQKVIYHGKGKNKKIARASVINATEPFIYEKLSEHINKKVSEAFDEIMNNMNYDLLCRILKVSKDIEVNELYKVFYKEYGKAIPWFASKELKEEVSRKWKERIEEVVEEINQEKKKEQE